MTLEIQALGLAQTQKSDGVKPVTINSKNLLHDISF